MSDHVVSVRLYLLVFVTLLALTALTTTVAFIDLGPLNVILMLTIACTKALLVVLYFMHVRYSTPLTWVVVSSGFLWLLVLITFTMSDVVTRGILG
jgi:cytochrome c oxidase subunit 4